MTFLRQRGAPVGGRRFRKWHIESYEAQELGSARAETLVHTNGSDMTGPYQVVKLRMVLQERDLLEDFFRQQIIVSIGVLHPFPLRQFKQSVTGSITPSVGASLPFDAFVVAADYVKATVGRPVVDDNHFLAWIALVKRALNALRDPSFGIVTRNQN